MKMTLRSALVLGGGIGLAYALSPRVRDRINPTVRGASKYAGKVADGYKTISKKTQRSSLGDFVPTEGIEDLKAVVRSFSKRLTDLEKTVRPGSDGRMNEYQGRFMN